MCGEWGGYDWVLMEFLSLRLVHTELLEVVKVQLSLTPVLLLVFCWWIFAIVIYDSLFTCLSNSRDNSFPGKLTSLKDLRRAVDFLVCSLFYFLEYSGNFPTSYKDEQETGSPTMCSSFYLRNLCQTENQFLLFFFLEVL